MDNEFLVTISGPDNPGITSSLMECIISNNCKIKDMGQAVTHGLLSLSILINTGDTHPEEHSILKELLFTAKKLGQNLEYKIIDQNYRLQSTVNDQKFMLNCVAPNNISADFLKDVATTLAKHKINIHRIDNVNQKNFKCLEITTTVPENLDWNEAKGQLLLMSNKHAIDIAFLKDNVYRRSKRLIVFDMDSTLIQAEVIDEMAKALGVGEEISKITDQAMNGEIDFTESLIKRVSKLEGLTVEQMKEILEALPITTGVEDFIRTVKSLGYKVAIISGGFSFFAEALKDKFGLDYAFSNELEIENGKLTGKVLGSIVDANQKANLLKLIAQQEKIKLEQVVAIGDGANDLPMMSVAGLGIAFHAKQIVREKAEQNLSHGPMTTILYFLGIPGPVL
jgi:phosphoserine phosphatase